MSNFQQRPKSWRTRLINDVDSRLATESQPYARPFETFGKLDSLEPQTDRRRFVRWLCEGSLDTSCETTDKCGLSFWCITYTRTNCPYCYERILSGEERRLDLGPCRSRWSRLAVRSGLFQRTSADCHSARLTTLSLLAWPVQSFPFLM